MLALLYGLVRSAGQAAALALQLFAVRCTNAVFTLYDGMSNDIMFNLAYNALYSAHIH